jgi:hypothetical protein
VVRLGVGVPGDIYLRQTIASDMRRCHRQLTPSGLTKWCSPAADRGVFAMESMPRRSGELTRRAASNVSTSQANSNQSPDLGHHHAGTP